MRSTHYLARVVDWENTQGSPHPMLDVSKHVSVERFRVAIEGKLIELRSLSH